MRRSTQHAVPRVAQLIVFPLALALLACAPVANVAFDEHADFAHYRTWDWQPQAGPRVDAPEENAALLEGRVSRLISRGLQALGYPRGAERPDLRVGYRFTLLRRREVVGVARAPYLLSSMSSSPSYWIEGTDTEERFFGDLRLVIEIADAGGRIVWKGGVRRRVEAEQQPDIGSAVAWLLERFPHASRPPPEPATEQLALGN